MHLSLECIMQMFSTHSYTLDLVACLAEMDEDVDSEYSRIIQVQQR